MGVDFSHCEAHWSYSGFNLFRRRIASIIMKTEQLIDDLYGDKMIYRYMVNESIYPLIDHSGCDGELTPKELKQIIPQFENALNKIEDEYDADNGKELLRGMKLALDNNENLEFY